MRDFSRRELLKQGAAAASAPFLAGKAARASRASGRNRTSPGMIILGFDGMDPGLLESMMRAGELPAFQRLRSEGDYRRLRTSLPPQSPVAWSNFITGMDPGGHGIFDFIHRDPKNALPYLSTSRVEAARRTITLGNYVIPITGGKVELLRRGRAFWQILEDRGVPATIVQIPSNFPPAQTGARTLAGMGTPDVLGTYGIFNFYTTRSQEMMPDIGGGKINLVEVAGNVVESALEGPHNDLRRGRPAVSLPFKVFLDPVHPVAKIVIQDHEFILNEGEWSDWKRIRFPMIPTRQVAGICRFHLKQVHPDFKLYVSPVNLDPADPALPISTPAGYSKELAQALGPFFTKGLPADTMALSHGVLDEAEFLAQDESILQESLRLFDYELRRFEGGLWFHYFSSPDQRQHMFMRLRDKSHPTYDPVLASRFGRVIEDTYRAMDRILGRALDQAGAGTVVMVMSDHGFTEYRRAVHLNSWLLENGYMKLLDPWYREQAVFFENTDWRRTRAYALGFNSLYLNLKGREGGGIVEPGREKESLIRELKGRLEELADPLTGERAVHRVYAASESYHGPCAASAPDLVVGYSRGYRASSATPLGRMPRGIIVDNDDKWGGDHCMDPELLPGILLTNRRLRVSAPSLCDLTATILHVFGIGKPAEMIGQSVL